MTSSNGNIFRVTGHLCGEFPGEFPTQRPVTRSFDVFFDLHPNKRSSKQWWGLWFETPPCPLWRHRNVKQNGDQSIDMGLKACKESGKNLNIWTWTRRQILYYKWLKLYNFERIFRAFDKRDWTMNQKPWIAFLEASIRVEACQETHSSLNPVWIKPFGFNYLNQSLFLKKNIWEKCVPEPQYIWAYWHIWNLVLSPPLITCLCPWLHERHHL